MNLFFEVYPYDEESEGLLEVTLKNGKKLNYPVCWKHSGREYQCAGKVHFNFQ